MRLVRYLTSLPQYYFFGANNGIWTRTKRLEVTYATITPYPHILHIKKSPIPICIEDLIISFLNIQLYSVLIMNFIITNTYLKLWQNSIFNFFVINIIPHVNISKNRIINNAIIKSTMAFTLIPFTFWIFTFFMRFLPPFKFQVIV